MARRSPSGLTQFIVLACLLALLAPVHAATASSQGAENRVGPSGNVSIDFDAVQSVPAELQPPIRLAVATDAKYLPDAISLTVTAFRRSEHWMYAVLVPRRVIASGWEEQYRPTEVVEILARSTRTGGWVAHVRGSAGHTRLSREAPASFIDATRPTTSTDRSVATASVEYLFPWTGGHEWYKTQGWHQGNNLDLQPVVRSNPPVDLAVLAAAAGRFTEICNDGTQSNLRVEHADGNTEYAHLAANSIRRDLLGQTVPRGQFLGLLHNASNYNTPCGSGTAVHLHFMLPRRDMAINGHNANDVANAAFATRYRSSNARIDGALYRAAHHSQSAYPTIARGDTGTVNFRFTNTGTATWRRDRGVNLATVDPATNAQDYNSPFYDSATWRSPNRPAALAEDSVAPGQVGTFNTRLRVPADLAPGQYKFRVRPVADGSGWMEPTSMDVWLTVTVVQRHGWRVEHYADQHLGWSCASGYEDSTYIFRYWGDGAQAGCPSDGFSARFTRTIAFPGGRYIFHVDHDDGARLWVDDRPVVDSWGDCGLCPSEGVIDLPAGDHVVRIEYRENGGAANLAAWWSGPGFLPAKQARIAGQWYGEYWGNSSQLGVPVLARNEGTAWLGRNYGSGGPGYGLPSDDFSARWRRVVDLVCGHYVFTVSADDGVRLWVGDRLLIDRWYPQAWSGSAEVDLPDGSTEVRVDYFEAGDHAAVSLTMNRTSACDTVAPTVGAPVQSIATDSQLGASTVPVKVTWSGSDTGSGVASYQVQQRKYGSTAWGAWSSATSGTTAKTLARQVAPGRYQFQVRAVDKAGNWSAWNPGTAFTVAAYQETSTAAAGKITYSGTWSGQASSSASGGSTRYATARGSQATFSFTGGRQVAWVAPKASNRGNADVYLDGVKVATVSLYVTAEQHRRVVFARTGLDPTVTHTLKVYVLGTKPTGSTGTRVDIDGFVVVR